MMNSNAFNMPPQTPSRRKRQAPSTPRISTIQKRRLQTPSRTTVQTPSTGDRFIPNRARTSISKANRTLCFDEKDDNGWQSQVYQKQLRKVLFDDSSDNRIMEFGPSKPSQATQGPYQQDILRSTLSAAKECGNVEKKGKVEITRRMVLDSPKMMVETDFTLMSSFGDKIAVALADALYLWNDGNVELLAEANGSPYTCVKFSEDGKHLAVGQDECFQVYRIADSVNGRHYLAYEKFHHTGYITALAWSGMKVVASGEDGIKAIDLGLRHESIVTYGPEESFEVRNLQWKNGVIASASREKGVIQLFDSQTRGEQVMARCTLQHEEVRSIEFNNSGILVSGGKDSVKFWHVFSGKLRREIQTEAPVKGTVYFEEHREIIVAEEDKLVLYSLGQEVTKIAEEAAPHGVLFSSVTAGPNETVICACDNETLVFYSILRTATKKRKIRADQNFGLKFPVIR